MSKNQGRLVILVLAAILVVQLLGRENLVLDINVSEHIGAAFGVTLVSWFLGIAKWAAVGFGALALIALIVVSVAIWWNVREVGRAAGSNARHR
ncbi:hypothetical protein BH10PSE7_BH10PSE7_25720 [soil metagenome]